MKPIVVCTQRVPLDHLEPLSGLAELMFPSDPELLMPRAELLAAAPLASGILNHGEARADRELLDLAPNLRIVANAAAGFDNLDLPELTARRVWATNAPDAFTDSTADITLALLLALCRRVAEGDRFVRSGAWPQQGLRPARWEGILLRDRVLGVVGHGRIGSAVADRARAFGMQVVYTRSHPDGEAAWRSLEDLLRQSDVVSLHTPLGDATRHLLNRETLALLKPGALVINVARGPVIDEEALVEALQEGRIGGAALDVFEREPEVHPALLGMPQVVLTPHVGGATTESRRAARRVSARHIAEVLAGGAPSAALNRI